MKLTHTVPSEHAGSQNEANFGLKTGLTLAEGTRWYSSMSDILATGNRTCRASRGGSLRL